MLIRVEIGIDAPGIDALLRRSFAGDAEAQLVHDLREDGLITLGLVATDDEGQVVGYVAFSPVIVQGEELQWVGMAPLAVDENYRGRGLARQLVYEGLDSLNEFGYAAVVVLGDPAFYERLGFKPASRYDLRCHWPGTETSFWCILWRMMRSTALPVWWSTTIISIVLSRLSRSASKEPSPLTRRSFWRFVSCLMRYSSLSARDLSPTAAENAN